LSNTGCSDHTSQSPETLGESKVFELPALRFDPSEEAHRELAAVGRTCTQKVADWIESGGPGDVRSIGKLRSMVRDMLAEELGEIDEWVEPLLHANE
jgi:hypothetical protein